MSDDPAFNIKFVEVVEKYECIYDYRRQDHSKRDVVEKAWGAIGSELKLSVSQCKEKWKNLRTAFSRSMKKPPSGSGAKRTKDYYLKDVMQFLTPFMKSKAQQSNLPNEADQIPQENSDFEFYVSEIIASATNSQDVTCDKPPEEKNKSTHAQCSDNASIRGMKRRKIPPKTLNEVDKCFIEYMKSKKGSAVEKSNPDMEFLKSLLPDIAKLNDYQKRQFKKRTLETLDELLCDNPLQSNSFVVIPSPVDSNYSVQSNASNYTTYSHLYSTTEYGGGQVSSAATYIPNFSPKMSSVNDDRNS
ncbi:uncharacterized protein LOC129778274 [Toxorhynchites rutilus septentrionalis]|uniref:uncharacterized protein LOC129769487 n=1 Tax=Toxorhynchites rutilus septentrionalis TaxID=329112 RepID=UPI0024790505|nr:uncharacterized protein LOC129769487 [Toxorhynchites rutilus septentrionalis]XP_055627869.1 uncharacterized protein LOC129769547 [Toxorhynchites rutilus septentrionalis]XP_055627874.1 uncharacterized protein LOC129769556 [Toxorhynchites rutilus septentrionalis]XP_055641046.1 uncharacterized protein LOC129778274 [Toxorhynchites rutilus septentrionalis]